MSNGQGDPRFQTVNVVVRTIRMMDRFGKDIPTPQQVQDFLGVNRSTAYRYINSIKDARGLYMGPRKTKKQLKAEELEYKRKEVPRKVREMRNQGLKWDYIAASLGIDRSTAQRMLWRGWA